MKGSSLCSCLKALCENLRWQTNIKSNTFSVKCFVHHSLCFNKEEKKFHCLINTRTKIFFLFSSVQILMTFIHEKNRHSYTRLYCKYWGLEQIASSRYSYIIFSFTVPNSNAYSIHDFEVKYTDSIRRKYENRL